MRRLLLAAALVALPCSAWAGAFDSVAPFTGLASFPLNLSNAGTSGQYDAQISVTGGGSVAGQGTTNYKSGLHMFLAYDGSPQFSIGYQTGATEYWTAQGGKTGAGGILYASNGTLTGNVTGRFIAQNQGGFCFGNGSGDLGCFRDGGGIPTTRLWFAPGNSLSSPGVPPSIYSDGDLALVPGGASNRITAVVPDGTVLGGAVRAAGCRDWQGPNDRSNQFQVCAGDHGVILNGANNTVGNTGAYSVVSGFGGNADGGYCASWGNQASCDGRRGVDTRSATIFGQAGDTQIVRGMLTGVSIAGAAVRLTANQSAAGAGNCWNLPAGKVFGGTITLVGQDATTNAHQLLWTNRVLMARNNNGTMTVTNGTADAVISPGADTITVSATADSTNFCLNFTVTPTTQTSDTWYYTAQLDGAEVRH